MKMYEKLKEVRRAKGYSIEDMGEVIGKSGVIYFKKERGDVNFTVSEAIKIAKFFKKKVENIFFKEELAETESDS